MPGLVVGGTGFYVGEGQVGSRAVDTTLQPPLLTNTNSAYSPVGAPVPPTIAGTASGSEATSTTSVSIGLPSGIQAGDICVIFLGKTGGNPTFPAGWTVDLGPGTPKYARAYRYCDGSEGSSITVTFTASTFKAWVVYLVRGADDNAISIVGDSLSFSFTSNADPASVAVPATWQDSAAISFAVIAHQDCVTTISTWPTGYTESLVEVTSGSTASDMRAAAAVIRHDAVGSAINPSAFTLSASESGHTDTLVIRAKSAGVRHAYKPGALASSNVIYAPTASTGGGASVQPPALASSNAFFAPAVRFTYKPSLLSSSFAAFTPSVRLTVKPAAVASAGAVFAPSARRAVRPPALSSSFSAFAPSIRLTVKPSAVSSSFVAFAPTVTTVKIVQPPAVASSSSVFAPSTSRTVKPAALASGASIFAPATRRTVRPPALASSSSVFAPSLRLTVKPAALASGAAVFAPAVLTSGTVAPAFVPSTNAFYGPTVIVSRIVNAPLLPSTVTVFAPTVTTGATPPAAAQPEVWWPIRRRKRDDDVDDEPTPAPAKKKAAKKWSRDLKDALLARLDIEALRDLDADRQLEISPAGPTPEQLAAELAEQIRIRRLRDDDEAIAIILQAL